MKIDDMKVSDFLYLIDCMQEECCESTCPNCRYIDFCEIDLPSIDSISLRKTIEEYAEMNRLFDDCDDKPGLHYIRH